MSCSIPGLTANIAGRSYDLNSDQIVLNAYDLNLSSVNRLSQRSPAQIYGDTDLGFRMSPRFSDFEWTIRGADLDDYRARRGEFVEIWTPRVDDPVQLVFDFGGGLIRALDLVLDDELVWMNRNGKIEQVSGVFKSSDPRLYAPDLITVTFDLAGSSGSNQGWPIPWPIPWPIGANVLNLTQSIEYAGLSRLGAVEYPVIRIFGPISSPAIVNETTEEMIDLSADGGLSLADSSEWVEIDLTDFPRRDSKTIRDQDGNSADNYMSTGSDLATWHLAPKGEKLPSGAYCDGINNITVTGTGVDATTEVSLRYYDRYHAV